MNREIRLYSGPMARRKTTYIQTEDDFQEWLRRLRFLFGQPSSKFQTEGDVDREFPKANRSATHTVCPLPGGDIHNATGTHLVAVRKC